MKEFDYQRASDVSEAVTLLADRPQARFLGGGTNLVDLMKTGVENPDLLVDVRGLPLDRIEVAGDGSVRIGATVTNSDLAADPEVRRRYPALVQAVLAGASGQLRNMATVGGNLLQRTRCGYFGDTSQPCNKRVPGSGCPALTSSNRMHAILGTSDSCAATHASDVAVALVALDARVKLADAEGTREVALRDFYQLPGDTPALENDLRPGELITEVVVPRLDWATNSTYVKVRDRQSYEFALCSAAVALDVRDGKIADARVAAGGVGTVPWHLPAVEDALRGAPATQASFEAAAAVAADGAHPLSDNGFKVSLLKRTIVRALLELTEGSSR